MSEQNGMQSVRVAPQGLPGWLQALVVLFILAAGIGAAVAFVKTKPETKKQPEAATAPVVEVATIEVGARPVSMQLNGLVVPKQRVVVMPEVGGRVVWQSDQLVPGGMLKKGEPLVRIDPRDYALALQQQEAQLQNQRLALQVEQSRGKVAEREWDLFRQEREQAGLPAPPQVDPDSDGRLALRQPQQKAAEVAVNSANSSVSRAKLALSKTGVTAPFNAFVQSETVDVGQLVVPASQLAILVGTDAFWVQVSIPMDKLDFVALPQGDKPGSTAKVWIETGRDKVERDGRVVRLLGDLDGVGRMARLLVEIEDPFRLASKDPKERGLPLLLGAYVRVAIDGVALEGVAEIPRRALREQDKVYALAQDDTLSIRTINVVWGTDETVLVTGPLKHGDRLVTSALATPIEGMKLRPTKSGETEAKVEAAP